LLNYQVIYQYFVGFKTQITGGSVGEVRAVTDMHQRKAEMARQADAFIALPGWFCGLFSWSKLLNF